MGSVARSYMRNGFLIYEEMRKCLIIYEEAIKNMTLQLIPSDFLINEENLILFFISVPVRQATYCRLAGLYDNPMPYSTISL